VHVLHFLQRWMLDMDLAFEQNAISTSTREMTDSAHRQHNLHFAPSAWLMFVCYGRP